MVELLAPAGGPEAGYAALSYGADAVYLGLPRFSARAEAVNFSPEEFANFVGYAHHLGRRVYITLNTLIKSGEIPQVLEALALVADCGADAIIVQDLGLLRLAARHFPEIRLHASTQMAIHNREGAEFLRDLGVKRVTLARELTLAEIADISAVAGIETEAFLHGALCYSYSGLCLYSSMLKSGRSANRGRCAYPCREEFSFTGSAGETDSAVRGHAFSLKDLALAEHLPEILSAGVASLKIEGRKKSPLYVAMVVKMYRSLLDRGGDDPDYPANALNLKTVFSRPWTDFFVGADGRVNSADAEIVGHRGAPVGTVGQLKRDGLRKWLCFESALGLELHDGLQIDLPGQPRPYGFAVNELHICVEGARAAGKPCFTAPAGAQVEVLLPEDAPFLPQGAAIYRSSSQELKRDLKIDAAKPGEFRPRLPLRVSVAITPGQFRVCLEITGLGREAGLQIVHEFAGEFAPARNPAAMPDTVRQVFGKTGDTGFLLDAFELHNDSGLFAPVSVLNSFRRDCYEALAEELEAVRRQRLARIVAECAAPADAGICANSAKRERWSIKVESPDALSAFTIQEILDLSEVVLDISAMQNEEELYSNLEALAAVRGREGIRLSLPAICRQVDRERLMRQTMRIMHGGFFRWEVANLWGLRFLREMNTRGLFLDIAADWPLYVLNPQSREFLRDNGIEHCTLNPEDEAGNMRELLRAGGGEGARLVLYADLPLFTGEACPRAALAGCGRTCSDGERRITGAGGDGFILVSRGCRSFLLGARAYSLAGRLEELRAAGASDFRADFLLRGYTPERVREIYRQVRAGIRPDDCHEGNYYRQLL